jgi:UDP-N-acetylmuramoyl-tripeptide--D-alanyl-D-alanine ligase
VKIPLQDVAAALGHPAGGDSPVVTGWSVDTRTLEPGDLFFALRGPNHDGHDYVETAFARGAVAAVVERPINIAGTQMVVADSLDALQRLAAWARQRWGGEVVGVTGSAGKTTTKDAIAHLLSAGIRAGKTIGNFNNDVGVPLSILRLPDDVRVAVLEIGMNHAGEIQRLASMAKPRIGVVTNVGYAHVENFETGIEGVAIAKRELIEALPPDGTAVLNADDPRVAAMALHHSGRVIRFGICNAAEVRAEAVSYSEDGSRFIAGGVEFKTPVSGRHAVLNLLAGVAVAGLYGIEPARLKDAVRTFTPGKMRGAKLAHAGMIVYDDSYNSNPDAARAMIDVLRDTSARRRIAVLGEMLELGRWAEPLHRDVGRYAAVSGISVLVGIRGVARKMVDAAIEGGLPKDAAFFFEDPDSAGDFLRTFAREGDAILFKGSRGTQVERALRRFMPASEGNS